MTPAASLNGQELELFRVGDYTALGKGKYTAADLQGVVERYAEAGEAPIAIGHVKSDKEPAYGWLKSVRFSGDTLYGTPGDVVPELDQLHREKRYRNRSIAFDKDPQGRLYIHHLAVLGAVPPRVQGLREATFSSTQYQEFAISDTGDKGDEMADELDTKVEGALSRFFAKFSAKQEPSADELKKQLRDELKAEFAAELKAEREAREAAVQEFSAFKKTAENGTAKARAEKAVSDLRASGAWVPAYEKLGVPELFSALAERNEVITFSNAKGEEQKPNLLDAAFQIFSAVGRIVPVGQRVEPGKAGSINAPATEVNGATVDAASATFSAMVTEHAEKNKISWNQAYDELERQGKKPKSGASAAGAV